METTQRRENLELELLPEELYGNIRGPLHSAADAFERPNPAMEGGIFEQLYHRNVFHIGLLYALFCWVAVQIAPPLFKELHFPSWITAMAGIVAVLGFPVITIFAWNRELTPLGWQAIRKMQVEESLTPHVRTLLNRAILLVLGVGVAYLVIEKFWLPARDAGPASPTAIASAPAAAPAPAPAPVPPPAGNAAVGAVAAPTTSIAVLAFTDADDAKDLGYLAHGLAEELLPVLGGLPQLAVTSGDSSFRFRSADVDAVSTGATLGVRYLVGGTVRRVEDRVQINAQLIDARDGSRPWTQTFERDRDSAFRLRDDVAAGVAKALAIPVGPEGLHSRLVVKNTNALELYLRGRQAFSRDDRAGFEQAADFYAQALDLEPQSATIEAGLAELNLAMVQRGYLAPQLGVERARQAAEIAESLDSNVGKAHRVLAVIHSQYDWDWHGAQRELGLARSLNAQDPRVLAELGYVDLASGQAESAARNLQAALALDPLNSELLLELGLAQYWGGHLDQAEDSLRHAVQINRTLKSAHYFLGKVLLARGDQQGALAEVKSEPDAQRRLAGLAEVQYASGRKAESDAALAQLKSTATTQWASGLAAVYASRNEADSAFQWLDRAYAQKDADLRILRGNPSFQNVAADPRFREFLRKMNLPV